MEFEDMKRIWDTQANAGMFVIDEKALHRRIAAKREKGRRITNISEWLSIAANIGAGMALLGTNLSTGKSDILLYLLPSWMLLVGVAVLASRLKRNAETPQFDRTIKGDLDHAIQLASYQVRLSNLMRWNMIPVAILLLLSLWSTGNSMWMIAGIALFFILAYFASRVEHNYYRRRKMGLEVLRDKLTESAA